MAEDGKKRADDLKRSLERLLDMRFMVIVITPLVAFFGTYEIVRYLDGLSIFAEDPIWKYAIAISIITVAFGLIIIGLTYVWVRWEEEWRRWGGTGKMPRFGSVLIVFLVLIVLALLFFVSFGGNFTRNEPPQYRNLILSCAAAIAILVAWIGYLRGVVDEKQLNVNTQQLKLAQAQRLSDTLSRAVDQLGNPSKAVNAAGARLLARLARENSSEREMLNSIFVTLLDFVREKSPEVDTEEGEQFNKFNPYSDCVAVAIVSLGEIARMRRLIEWQASRRGIGLGRRRSSLYGTTYMERIRRRRRPSQEESAFNLDFTKRYFGGMKLSNAYLREAIFNGARLMGAKLTKVDLEGAELRDAILCNAMLSEMVSLEKADFGNADLLNARRSSDGENFARYRTRSGGLKPPIITREWLRKKEAANVGSVRGILENDAAVEEFNKWRAARPGGDSNADATQTEFDAFLIERPHHAPPLR